MVTLTKCFCSHVWIIQLTRKSPKADFCSFINLYLTNLFVKKLSWVFLSTVMCHLLSISLLNVVEEILVDRCLQTDVCGTGWFMIYMNESSLEGLWRQWWLLQGGFMLPVTWWQTLHIKVSCCIYALCMFRFSLPPCSDVSRHPSA